MVSILLVYSIEWRWCVLLLVRPVQWCDPCPAHPGAVLTTTAVMSCYCLAAMCCGVWVVCVSVCAVHGWGILCLPPPLVVDGGWGYRWVVGGMVRWGGIALKGGYCDGDPPVCVLVSPFGLRGGPVEWRGAVRVVLSPSRVVPVLFVVFLVLCCLASPLVLCVVGGGVWWCVL